MNNLIFLPEAWEDYLYWQTEDKRTLKRINQLIADILRNGYDGIGKPEPLKGNLSGWWSRRIDDSNRLLFRLRDDGYIEIAQCRGHYSDR
ncbi:MAG: Txe/YoeB family addiction module toxin [Deferribacteraceae bacterium]|jgi:toxin YoeB|nr:Txe/YoeB family addiction module toxin [Deferribacteraceae bacterium]